mgnify:CR=1 FL=1
MFSKRKKGSIDLSLPKEKTVHGIPVTKVPVGKYIASMQDIQDLPMTIMEKCFPGEDLQTVINQAKAADSGFVLDLTGKLMVNAPEIIIDLASQYLSVEKEELLALSPTELLDVLEAWWELNDLSDFFGRVWKKIKPLLASQFQTQALGSNDG